VTTGPAPDAVWHHLHPRVTMLWWWSSLGRGVALGAVAFVALSILDVGASWVVRAVACLAGGALLGAVAGWITVPRRYRRWRYRFGEDALEVERGIWWRTVSAVPYQRIQQVEVGHGPLQRRLGMVTLSLRTASLAALGTLPGIAADEATEVRAALLRHAGEHDGV
jgi:uncharacterized protein